MRGKQSVPRASFQHMKTKEIEVPMDTAVTANQKPAFKLFQRNEKHNII